MWCASSAAGYGAKARWWIGGALLSLALAGARAEPPAEVDTAWRQRMIHENLADAYRSFSAVAEPALKELKAPGPPPGGLRRHLQLAARYAVATYWGGESPSYCDDLRGWLQEAIDAGPAYRSELFDIYTNISRIAKPCKDLPAVDVRQLAATLGDPARLYFVLVSEARDQQLKKEMYRARWLLDQAHAHAVTDLQHVLLAFWSFGIESHARDLKNPEEAQAARLEEARRIDPWRGRVRLDDYPRLKYLFAVFPDRSQYQLQPQTYLGVLDSVKSIARGPAVPESHRRAFEMIYGSTLIYADRPRDAIAVLERHLQRIEDSASPAEVKVINNYLARSYAMLAPEAASAPSAAPAAPPGTPPVAAASAPQRARAATAAPAPDAEAYAKGLAALRASRKAVDPATPKERADSDRYLQLMREADYHEQFGKYQEALAAEREAAQYLEASLRNQLKYDLRREDLVKARTEDREKYDLLRATEVQAEKVRGLTIAAAVAGVGLLAVAAALWVVRRRGKQLARVSAELAERNGELEARNQSRTQLLAAACHDLRQPAHALGMLVELGRDAHARRGDFEPWLDKVNRCTTVLSDMLGELMDLGSLEGGAYKPSPAEVDLAELMHDVMLNFAPAARRKGLALEAPPVPVVVHSDRHLLRRILFNLVSNAVKYTEHGRVQVQVAQDEDWVTLRVQDTGPGIPEERLKDVMRDYVRLDNNHAADGLGIGLSVVRRAAELLGHELTLDSRVGQGTVVTLRLPLVRRIERPAAAGPKQAAGQALHGLVVVLMEDDVDVREAVATLLRRWGCVVVGGDAAAGVLQQLTAGRLRPGLVMTDMNLHGADGLLELAALREALHDPALPALVVTGDLDASVATRAAQQQAFVAHKPLGPGKLEGLVRQLARPPASAPVVNGQG